MGQGVTCPSENPGILLQVNSSLFNVIMIRIVDFKLYLVTDKKLFTNEGLFVNAVEEALKAGVRAVQLREKDLGTRDLLELAYKMRDLTAGYGARLFINDRSDIAMCVKADGVHLGQTSMPVFAVRKVVGDSMMIGVSTHTLNEAETAEREGADFITFGPVYQTPSKLKYGEPVGLDALLNASEQISIPVFGIGGIKPYNMKDVIGAGARGVAVISGILGEADVKSATDMYMKEMDRLS